MADSFIHGDISYIKSTRDFAALRYIFPVSDIYENGEERTFYPQEIRNTSSNRGIICQKGPRISPAFIAELSSCRPAVPSRGFFHFFTLSRDTFRVLTSITYNPPVKLCRVPGWNSDWGCTWRPGSALMDTRQGFRDEVAKKPELLRFCSPSLRPPTTAYPLETRHPPLRNILKGSLCFQFAKWPDFSPCPRFSTAPILILIFGGPKGNCRKRSGVTIYA